MKKLPSGYRHGFPFLRDSARSSAITISMIKAVCASALLVFVFFVDAAADPARFQAIRDAAAAGDPKSQNRLGVYYQLGLDTPQDENAAVIWFRKAAEQENADAQCNLAEMYEQGRGVGKDLLEACFWYGKSCDNGCGCACRSFRRLMRSLGRPAGK